MLRDLTLPIAAATLLAACVTPAVSQDSRVGTGEWHLIAVGGEAVDWTASIAFAADGTVSGQAPCNRWFGTNAVPLPGVQIDGIGATKMACPDLAAEAAWFETLGQVRQAEVDQGHLFLIGREGLVVEFVADPAAGEPCLSCLARQ